MPAKLGEKQDLQFTLNKTGFQPALLEFFGPRARVNSQSSIISSILRIYFKNFRLIEHYKNSEHYFFLREFGGLLTGIKSKNHCFFYEFVAGVLFMHMRPKVSISPLETEINSIGSESSHQLDLLSVIHTTMSRRSSQPRRDFRRF